MNQTEQQQQQAWVTIFHYRRGVVKASITKFAIHLSELENQVLEPMTLSYTQKLSAKLESLTSEFKVHHYSIVDAISDDKAVEENIAKEEDELDQHDSDVADLSETGHARVPFCNWVHSSQGCLK